MGLDKNTATQRSVAIRPRKFRHNGGNDGAMIEFVFRFEVLIDQHTQPGAPDYFLHFDMNFM